MENALCLLSDVCRLCLDLPGKHSIRDTCDLMQDLVKYIGIKISLEDGLPQSVCARCYYRIEAIKDLKECAICNDKYMNSLMNNSCETHEVSLPTTAMKIMTDIVGNDPEQVNSYLYLEKTKLRPNGNIKNNGDNHTQNNDQKRISVKPLKDLIKNPERMAAPKDSIRVKNEKRKSSTEGDSRTRIKKEKRRSTSDDSKEKKDSEFRCDICDKSCSTARKLYHHQRTHSKKLFCPLDACGKSFASKGDLQKHIRSHTGEKPYACSLCDKSFAQNVTLKAHRVAMHGGV